ncbi:MAG: hypothetical protein JW880_05185 [Candidatus Thermoplasmatota archaeon]|nr:hypothetical protein [Candidatus Thermoplasmatota archaeon]
MAKRTTKAQAIESNLDIRRAENSLGALRGMVMALRKEGHFGPKYAATVLKQLDDLEAYLGVQSRASVNDLLEQAPWKKHD